MGVETTVIEDVEFDEDEEHVVASVRPTARAPEPVWAVSASVPWLLNTAAGSIGTGGRWTLGTIQTWVEADFPRVPCAKERVVVAHVCLARQDSGHTEGSTTPSHGWLPDLEDRSHAVDAHRRAHRRVGYRPGTLGLVVARTGSWLQVRWDAGWGTTTTTVSVRDCRLHSRGRGEEAFARRTRVMTTVRQRWHCS